MPGASIGHHDSHDENTKTGGFHNQTGDMEGARQLCLLHFLAPSTVTSGIWPPPVPMNMNETQVKAGIC